MKRIIVCGSRGWTDRGKIADALNEIVSTSNKTLPTVVHGRCPSGADLLCDEEAVKQGLPIEPHPAFWDVHGKRAGFIRNEEMAALGADLCIAFWDGKSGGTQDMMNRAKAHGIPVMVVR